MIIEPALFQAVQEAMDRNPRRGREWDYVFTNFSLVGNAVSQFLGPPSTMGVFTHTIGAGGRSAAEKNPRSVA